MKSEIIVALVVLAVVAVHVALYHWVKFKVHEGVILKFLRDARGDGTSEPCQADAIVAHTEISAERVAVVCRRSLVIQADPAVENSWRAD